MKIIACILYNIVAIAVSILMIPFYIIERLIRYIIIVIKTLIAGTREIAKGTKFQNLKEKSDEETNIDEKPGESVFDDMSV